MKKYNLLNNIFGWVSFLIAAIVYIMTIEPTASFWDCSEFILSAFKLEVGHPPGAPFFMLLGNFFSLFAPDVDQVGKMVNIFSALCSAATILFLFWTITHLTKKIVQKENEDLSVSQIVAILGSGLVGALAYTFSDTFWFSAVEGEVYACSSLFTALVFWLILKWENHADESHSDRWIVLIAYLMGLSIGVHLLNLLAIPAIVLVYYYKKFSTTWKGTLIALFVSFVLIALLMYGLIPGMVRVAGWTELLFVNTFSLPFNTGVFVYCVLLIFSVLWGIYETGKGTNRKLINISFLISTILMGIPFVGSSLAIGFVLIIILALVLFLKKEISYRLLNTTLVSMMVMAIGYSTFAIIVIRSTANTPMDQNSPEDVFTLARYLNREQYGDRPLFYGQTFVADVVDIKETNEPVYKKKIKKDPNEKDEYIIGSYKTKVQYQKEFNMLFPRMYSDDTRLGHVEGYKNWSDFKGTPVTYYSQNGEKKTVNKPTFVENLRFFFRYQLGFMYFRYFMWNFSGRQNDIQGHGEIENGNAITGINFIDQYFIGDQSNLPSEWANNKGRNVFYCLPLLLGIIGLFFQFGSNEKGEQGFLVTFLLFFMTGIAIVIYLNQTPQQPRERDYAYAGSFYAYCIWIGMATFAIFKGLSKYIPSKMASALAVLLTILVPIQMASQTWDDHDRSNRTVCPDFGYNYLISCEPNAIIFTNGDNDTFPLWYLQEVEGVRTDIRVCNLSYFQTDWYIDQMKRQAYESDPLPISWDRSLYQEGSRDGVYIFDRIKRPISLEFALDFVKSESPQNKRIPGYSVEIEHFPSKQMYLPIDSAKLVVDDIVRPEDAHLIAKQIDFNFKEREIVRKDKLMILEMLQQNGWKRPMYYAISVGPDQYTNLRPYMRQTGMAYKITPFKEKDMNVDTEKMYDNLMHKFRFGGVEKPNIYLDENVLNMAWTLRSTYCTLAEAFIKNGSKDKAKEVLDYCKEKIPSYNVPYNVRSLLMGKLYYDIGDKETAKEILESIMTNTVEKIYWYNALSERQFANAQHGFEFQYSLRCFSEILRLYQSNEPEMVAKYKDLYTNLFSNPSLK